ncbi:hypothetical protein Cni_G16536 [Canna indica]|uniref:Uncharacterized protein n=1 Tax=Canna indica TaxID=4628 RepID=A0AAQ3KL19_9LILI|nr:hypothetical protein Cni_G16536 [Canna indica]
MTNSDDTANGDNTTNDDNAKQSLILGLCGSADGVHDILKEYGLPKGLLPHSKHHSFSDGNGELVVELKAPCYAQSSDIIYYDRIITGKLSYGIISDISSI